MTKQKIMITAIFLSLGVGQLAAAQTYGANGRDGAGPGGGRGGAGGAGYGGGRGGAGGAGGSTIDADDEYVPRPRYVPPRSTRSSDVYSGQRGADGADGASIGGGRGGQGGRGGSSGDDYDYPPPQRRDYPSRGASGARGADGADGLSIGGGRGGRGGRGGATYDDMSFGDSKGLEAVKKAAVDSIKSCLLKGVLKTEACITQALDAFPASCEKTPHVREASNGSGAAS